MLNEFKSFLDNKYLLLASSNFPQRFLITKASQPRKEIFRQEGLEIKTMDSKFVEDLDKSSFKTPTDYVKATANGKLHASIEILETSGEKMPDILIASDTINVKDGVIYEKPKDAEAHRANLRLFSEDFIECVTSVQVCFIVSGNKSFYDDVQVTKVHFKELDENAIDNYITKHPDTS